MNYSNIANELKNSIIDKSIEISKVESIPALIESGTTVIFKAKKSKLVFLLGIKEKVIPSLHVPIDWMPITPCHSICSLAWEYRKNIDVEPEKLKVGNLLFVSNDVYSKNLLKGNL